ncbi:MAG: tyrosine-type recombinase/integrase [Acidimicrobiales bacterium]
MAAPAITVVEQLVILDGNSVRKTPKTAAGRRRITLPAFLTELLATQLEERAGPGPDGLVFPNRAGNPINPSSFNGNHWKPAKERAGIDGVRFHDLRHTAVAMAKVSDVATKASFDMVCDRCPITEKGYWPIAAAG